MKAVYLLLCLHSSVIAVGSQITEKDISIYRQRVAGMFYHAYEGYIKYAYPYDELRPLSCDGVDTWGSFSLTLIDALDTLAVMGNFTEFRRVAQLLIDKAQFDMNINVSVFETNIRVIGGLLSAHLLSHRAGMDLEPGWPCNGPLLRLAETVGRKLLPAFETFTGMPYGTVNLRYGVPRGETPVTCTAGVTTFIVEFGTLSRLTGDPVFENTALRALLAMWEARSSIGLVGNHIDVQTSKWTALDSGIGAGVDSYYEYLVKGAILLQQPQLMEMFQEFREAISNHMLRDDWYMWVNMMRGHVTMPLFQSLEAYWPGVLSLVGDIEAALKSLHNYHQIWKQYGFTPEFYNIQSAEANNGREGYPLRPELIESIMYLYRATEDPSILKMGVDILESIQHSTKTRCGYATVKDVRDHKIEDRMESFFLAETTKYLYLLFDTTNFIHENGSRGTLINTATGQCIIGTGGYIFNTEAHPIDIAAVHCCSSQKKAEDSIIKQFESTLDLSAFYGLTSDDALKVFRRTHHTVKKKPKTTDLKKLRKNCPRTEQKESSDTQKTKSADKSEPADLAKVAASKTSGQCQGSITKIDGTVVHKSCGEKKKKDKIDYLDSKEVANSETKAAGVKGLETKKPKKVKAVKFGDKDNNKKTETKNNTKAKNVGRRTCAMRVLWGLKRTENNCRRRKSRYSKLPSKYLPVAPVTTASNVHIPDVTGSYNSENSKLPNVQPPADASDTKPEVLKRGDFDESVARKDDGVLDTSSDVNVSTDESSTSNDDMVKTHGLVSSMERDDGSGQVKNRILVKTYDDNEQSSSETNSVASDIDVTTDNPVSDTTDRDVATPRPSQTSSIVPDASDVPSSNMRTSDANSIKETRIPTETASQPDQESYSSPPTLTKPISNMTSTEYNQLLGISIPKPRRILWSNYGFSGDYDILACPAQPFLQRLSLMGEMFNIK